VNSIEASQETRTGQLAGVKDRMPSGVWDDATGGERLDIGEVSEEKEEAFRLPAVCVRPGACHAECRMKKNARS
jgi:hypothetical protein